MDPETRVIYSLSNGPSELCSPDQVSEETFEDQNGRTVRKITTTTSRNQSSMSVTSGRTVKKFVNGKEIVMDEEELQKLMGCGSFESLGSGSGGKKWQFGEV